MKIQTRFNLGDVINFEDPKTRRVERIRVDLIRIETLSHLDALTLDDVESMKGHICIEYRQNNMGKWRDGSPKPDGAGGGRNLGQSVGKGANHEQEDHHN